MLALCVAQYVDFPKGASNPIRLCQKKLKILLNEFPKTLLSETQSVALSGTQ